MIYITGWWIHTNTKYTVSRCVSIKVQWIADKGLGETNIHSQLNFYLFPFNITQNCELYFLNHDFHFQHYECSFFCLLVGDSLKVFKCQVVYMLDIKKICFLAALSSSKSLVVGWVVCLFKTLQTRQCSPVGSRPIQCNSTTRHYQPIWDLPLISS